MQEYFAALTERGLAKSYPPLFRPGRLARPPVPSKNIKALARAIAAHGPPETRRDPIVHVDPYRWLETESEQRSGWLRSQHGYADGFFRSCKSRSWWAKTLYAAFDRENVIKEISLGETTLELIDRGLKKPTELVRKKGGREIRTLFSTFDVARNGSAAATNFLVDPKKKYVLVPLARNGSIDPHDLHVIEIETGKTIEIIKKIRGNGSITWLSEDSFVYERLIGRDEISLIHRLGDNNTSTAPDRFVDPDSRMFNSKEGDLVFQTATTHTWVKGLTQDKWRRLDGLVIEEDFGREGNRILVKVRGHNGDKDRIAWIGVQDLVGDTTTPAKLTLVHTDRNDGVFKKLVKNEKYIVVYYTFGQHQWLEVMTHDGTRCDAIDMPDYCSIQQMKFTDGDTLQLTLTSQVVRSKKFQFDLKSKRFLDLDPQKEMLTDDLGQEYTSHYVTVMSKDGTRLPVRLTSRKGLALNGQNPALIQGYGGFNSPGYLYPSYSLQIKHFLDHGGVYAAPALRGGNEFGEPWHEQGMKDKKQNVFNDLYATAEFLIAQDYTEAKKLAAMGWSNGGLLMGVAATQRPDLFGLIIAGNGVQDMLRRENLDPEFNDGWAYEYGHTADTKLWPSFAAYSPVHNAKPQNGNPTVLVMVGQDDTRVDPAHSYKFAAALQQAYTGDPVVLCNIKNAGHWMTYDYLQDLVGWHSNVRIWSTIFDTLGINTNPSPPSGMA